VSRKILNVKALYEALDLVREHTGMSWRDLAADTGISSSAFSRLSQGHRPDADALVTLLAWLRVPADRFTMDAPEDA
jgi:transcriptional regulator with XRE-family HTH domain